MLTTDVVSKRTNRLKILLGYVLHRGHEVINFACCIITKIVPIGRLVSDQVMLCLRRTTDDFKPILRIGGPRSVCFHSGVLTHFQFLRISRLVACELRPPMVELSSNGVKQLQFTQESELSNYLQWCIQSFF